MASLLAVQLRHRIEAYLGRGLTIRQVKHCEEIVINLKPWVPLRYLEGLTRALGKDRQSMRNWGMFYFPLYALASEFRGFVRRKDFIFLKGRVHRIYRKCDLMAGDGFGEKDLDAVLFLVDECTDPEIETTFTIARTYGLRTLRHLRGIILKNRAVTILPNIPSLGLETDEKFCSQISQWAASKYPDVGSLRKRYRHRVNSILRGRTTLRSLWNEMDELHDPKEEGNGPEKNADTPAI